MEWTIENSFEKLVLNKHNFADGFQKTQEVQARVETTILSLIGHWSNISGICRFGIVVGEAVLMSH